MQELDWGSVSPQAVHEAAHAVVASYLGLPVMKVKLTENDHLVELGMPPGLTPEIENDLPLYAESLKKYDIQHKAGRFAERLFKSEPPRSSYDSDIKFERKISTWMNQAAFSQEILRTLIPQNEWPENELITNSLLFSSFERQCEGILLQPNVSMQVYAVACRLDSDKVLSPDEFMRVINAVKLEFKLGT